MTAISDVRLRDLPEAGITAWLLVVHILASVVVVAVEAAAGGSWFGVLAAAAGIVSVWLLYDDLQEVEP